MINQNVSSNTKLGGRRSFSLAKILLVLFSATVTDILVFSSGVATLRRWDQSRTNSVFRNGNVTGPSFSPTSSTISNVQQEEPISSPSAAPFSTGSLPPHSSSKKEKRSKKGKHRPPRSSGGKRLNQRKTGTSLVDKKNGNSLDTTPDNLNASAFGLERHLKSSTSSTNKNHSERRIRKASKMNLAFVHDHSIQKRKKSIGKNLLEYKVKHRNSARNDLEKKWAIVDDPKMSSRGKKKRKKRNTKTEKSLRSKAMLGNFDTNHKKASLSSEITKPEMVISSATAISSKRHSKTKISSENFKISKQCKIDNENKKASKRKKEKRKKQRFRNSDANKRVPTQTILQSTTQISPTNLIPYKSNDMQEETRVKIVEKKRKRKKVSNVTSSVPSLLDSIASDGTRKTQTEAVTPITPRRKKVKYRRSRKSHSTSTEKAPLAVNKIDSGSILTEEDEDKNVDIIIQEKKNALVDTPISVGNGEESHFTAIIIDTKTASETPKISAPLVILENKCQENANSNQKPASQKTSAATEKSIKNITKIRLSYSEADEEGTNNVTTTLSVGVEPLDEESLSVESNVNEKTRMTTEKKHVVTKVEEKKHILIHEDHPSMKSEIEGLGGKARNYKVNVDDSLNKNINLEEIERIDSFVANGTTKMKESRQSSVPLEEIKKGENFYKSESKFMHVQDNDRVKVKSNDESIVIGKRPSKKGIVDDESERKDEEKSSKRYHIVGMPREGVIISEKDKYQDTCEVRLTEKVCISTGNSIDSRQSFNEDHKNDTETRAEVLVNGGTNHEVINTKNDDINLEQDVVSFIEEILQEEVRSWIKDTDSFSDIIGNKTRGGYFDNECKENYNCTNTLPSNETGKSLKPERNQFKEKDLATIDDNNSKSSTTVQKDFKASIENLSRSKEQQEQEFALHRASLESLNDKKSDAVVSLVTWNLAEESPSEEEAVFIRKFRKNGISRGSDLVLISGQECENIKPRRSEGKRSREFRRLMIKMLGKEYVPLALHLLGGIQFGLFAKKSFLGDIEDISVADVKCGIGNVFHNKGAIAAFVKVKAKNATGKNQNVKRSRSLRMVFITSHLAAHVKNVEARDSDFWRISSELEAQAPEGFHFPRKVSNREPSGSFLFDSVDRVFICGDLNYRLDLPRELTEHTILHGANHGKASIKDLLRHDQLIHSMAEGRAFPGFAEGKITFLPTFKFDKGSSSYDTSHKQRIPAWTDRILFQPADGIRVLDYQSVPGAQTSDHRPVYGSYRISMEGRVIPSTRIAKNRKRINSSLRRTTTKKTNKEF
mmetsp:Transcript_33402/g.38017  ORF Transcript_33402/g.38017 Transcript_33402/m.38017 type:complete len:1289 (+) Transcript_33402:97-3963(+)